MPPPRDFRSGKGAWLGSRQNSAKISEGLNKPGYEISSCVTERFSASCSLYQIVICTLLESFPCDIVYLKAVLSFTPSS